MIGFVMAILGIALVSIVAVVSVNHVPIDAFLSTKARLTTTQGVNALRDGAVRYIQSITDEDGVAHLPAQGTNLNGVLQPAFAFIPPAPLQAQWVVQSASYQGLPAISICLSPSPGTDAAVLRGITSAKNQLPAAATFMGSACMSTSNSPGNYLTHWVIARHHN